MPARRRCATPFDGLGGPAHPQKQRAPANAVTDVARHTPRSAAGPGPLVSFVIIGRNDNYMGDYLYRLGTSISFLAQSAERAGLLRAVEVVVVDWGSERPLGRDLPLAASARRITRFLEVTPGMLRARHGEARWLPTTAVNVGVRRARGDFILFTDSDCLWSNGRSPASVVSCVASRAARRDTGCVLLRAPISGALGRPCSDGRASTNGAYAPSPAGGVEAETAAAECLGGYSAGQLMHRDLWFVARGYDESLDRPWGWSDNDLMLRVSQAHAWVDVSGYGVFGLHMEHWPRADGRSTRDPSTVNPMLVRNVPVVNGETGAWPTSTSLTPRARATHASDRLRVRGSAVRQTASPLAADWQSIDDRDAVAHIVRRTVRGMCTVRTIEPAVLQTILDKAPSPTST